MLNRNFLQSAIISCSYRKDLHLQSHVNCKSVPSAYTLQGFLLKLNSFHPDMKKVFLRSSGGALTALWNQ